jgi:hypothetical protein
MAKPNYSFEKKQRELAKKKKQDEKMARKQATKESGTSAADAGAAPVPGNDPTSPAGH